MPEDPISNNTVDLKKPSSCTASYTAAKACTIAYGTAFTQTDKAVDTAAYLVMTEEGDTSAKKDIAADTRLKSILWSHKSIRVGISPVVGSDGTVILVTTDNKMVAYQGGR